VSRDEHELEVDAALAGDDPGWWDFSGGNCGGCGKSDCHEGRCAKSLCRVCPDRIAEGWWDR